MIIHSATDDGKDRKVTLSRIFQWYATDFNLAAAAAAAANGMPGAASVEHSDGAITFAAKYTPELCAVLAAGPVDVSYFAYNWNLTAVPDEHLEMVASRRSQPLAAVATVAAPEEAL
jgi:hypothetical protein